MVSRDEIFNDPETSFRAAFDGRQAQIWTALPATVSSVDFTTMTIEAQPSIQGVITDSNGKTTFVNLPLLVDVPLCFPSAGGFSLTFPIKKDDEVLIIFSSRCIDSWFQSGGVGIPIENRMHDLSDGFAIPGPKSLPHVISSISSTVPELRNDSGSLKFRFTSSGFEILGDLSVDGDISATGDVTASGDVVAGTVSLKNHTHAAGSLTSPSGPVTGTTGGPI